MDKFKAQDETALSSHYRYGENWYQFAGALTEDQVEQAVVSLRRLLDEGALVGKTRLDVGCGSGLSSLAALRLLYSGLRGLPHIEKDPR
jgi:hypothetical protein